MPLVVLYCDDWVVAFDVDEAYDTETKEIVDVSRMCEANLTQQFNMGRLTLPPKQLIGRLIKKGKPQNVQEDKEEIQGRKTEEPRSLQEFFRRLFGEGG